MKATELRIGNWVKSGNTVIKVESIDEIGINLSIEEYDDTGAYIDYEFLLKDRWLNPAVKPIPITSEWLERFGFDKKSFTHIDKTMSPLIYTDGGKYFLQWYSDNFDLNEIDTGELMIIDRTNECLVTMVMFIHQLQNLYFDLTGKELKLSGKTPKPHSHND